MKKKYTIDPETWPEAGDHDFHLIVGESVGDIVQQQDHVGFLSPSQISKLGEVVKEKFPDLFEDFSQNLLSLLVDEIKGPERLVELEELLEELLVHDLTISLMWLGAQFNPDLIKEYH